MGKIGTLSAATLAKCGIDEKQVMLDMAQCIDIPNEWLPDCLRSEKGFHVTNVGNAAWNEKATAFPSKKIGSRNAASIIAMIDKQEQEQLAKRQLQAELVRREQIIQAYKRQDDNGATTLSMITTLEDELRIDNAYLACYADFVKLGILEPVTYDEMMEYEGTDE